MYRLDATRILYQTSRYAPVAVLQLDITVPEEYGAREQVSASLDRLDCDGFEDLLQPSGKASAVNIYCDLVLGLQQSVGHSVQYYRSQQMDAALEYRVFIEYEEEAAAIYAAEVATQLLNEILEHPGHAQLQQLLKEFEAYSRPRVLDSNSRLLIRAAGRHGIPVLRPLLPKSINASEAEVLNYGFQLGWGVYQQRFKGAISESLVSTEAMEQFFDRAQLYPHLQKASIPLPAQDLEFINRNRSRRAQRSAQRIGYPVILRPRAIPLFQYRFPEDYIFGPLHNDDQVALAAKYLSEHYGLNVWIESYEAGDQYRFLVMNCKVMSVLRCSPPVITGDGVQTIAELTEHMDDRDVLLRIQLSGLAMDSVLESGIQLALRGGGSLSNGGSCEDVTAEMPLHFKELAIRVAEQTGLRTLAGVDLTIENISGNAGKPNCVVNNVVPDPDLHMHAQLSDQPDNIGDELMIAFFPDGTPSRIPIVAVTGTNGKTTTCRMVKQILQAAGLKTGLACTDGVYLNNELVREGDSSGVSGAFDVFATPGMEAAVLETARGGMAHTGIAFDHCDVGACTNVASDHLGKEGIETVDEMAAHKRQVIERTSGTAVLNADDPRCLAMRENTAAREMILVASSASHPAIKKHCQAGGKAIAVDTSTDISNVVLLTPDDKITRIIAVKDLPASMGVEGAAHYNVMNAMFAIAITSGLGIEQALIVSTLKAFGSSVENTPGRLNEVTGLPFRVIVDVAHNWPGLRALVEFTNRLPVEGKKIINFSADGEKSDEHIKAFAKQTAGNFDLYVVKNRNMDMELTLKHRTYEEVPEMVKGELIRQGVPEENIIVELDVMDSLDRSMQIADKGDLLVVLTRVSTDEKFQLVKKLESAANL